MKKKLFIFFLLLFSTNTAFSDSKDYCNITVNKEIKYFYYKSNDKYDDMLFGISASFSKIFTPNFLKNNNKIYNIHLSLLPKLRDLHRLNSLF